MKIGQIQRGMDMEKQEKWEKQKKSGKKKNHGKMSVLAAAGILAVLLLCACGKTDNGGMAGSGEQDGAGTEAQTESGVFGVFQSETLEGEAVTQDVLKGSELTMVNIWATFCQPCISEMPDLAALNQEYGDRGFRIIGMISDVEQAGDETAKEIVEMTGADYTHIIASEDLRSGFLRVVNVVPTTIFLDSEGKRVGETYAGSRSREEWAEIIESLLEETDR